MSLQYSHIIRKFLFIFLILFFFKLLFNTLFVGGTWDLNEHIALAYRFLFDGKMQYANGLQGNFLPSSPYFPGVALISSLYGLLGANAFQNNFLMLLTAITIGYLYLFCLYHFTSILYPNIPRIFTAIFIALIVAFGFKWYLGYMIEFKPDTLLLLLGLLCIFILRLQPSLFHFILIGLLLSFSTTLKQSFFLVYLLVFLVILFSPTLSKKQKKLLCFCYFLLGLLTLFLLFRIDNLYHFCIDVMRKHQILQWNISRTFFIDSIKGNILFVAMLIFFFYKKIKEKSFSSLEIQYLFFSLTWFAFSSISAIKSGGNNGNVEVGLIVFMPFVIYATYITSQTWYSKKIFSILILLAMLIAIIGHANSMTKYLKGYIQNTQSQQQSIKFLKSHFKNQSVLVDGGTYITAVLSDLHVVAEAETIGHLDGDLNYNMGNLNQQINSHSFDILFLTSSLPILNNKETEELFKKKYILYQNAELPKVLQGKIWIPKKQKDR